MKKKLFIGIDFSKETIDVSFFEREKEKEFNYSEFENNKDGFTSMLKWIKSLSAVNVQEWIFCGEHTGLYSIELASFLVKKKFFIWLENPLQIKLSSGIKREKTDEIDSLDIALYASRFQDRAKEYQLPDKSFFALQNLLAFRERLVKNKVSLQVSANETRRVHKRDKTASYIYEHSMREIERLDKEIQNAEKQMLEIIEKDEKLAENYYLVKSVKGIGIINTVTILVHTQNFTTFENSRQFASFAGMAPFEDSSGTSRKRGKHIKKLGTNKEMKALLTQAARSAVVYDEELRSYYQRKLAEGKLQKVVINNVRNKLLHRIFAVVAKKQPFQKNYMNPLSVA